MRLNNTELNIVVEEIFNKVSKDSYDQWNDKLNNVVISDEVTNLYEKWVLLGEQARDLLKEQNELQKSISGKTFNGFTFPNYTYLGNIMETYLKHRKLQIVGKPNFPTQDEIRSRIILSGYNGIPELIDKLIEYYDKK